MDERKSNPDEDWVKELSAADIGMWQHPERPSVKIERPDTCQLSVDSHHAYPRNQNQPQFMQQQLSAGCNSFPLVAKREQEQLNVLQQTDRTTLQKMLESKSGVVLERANPRLQAPALHQSQNLTLADQLKSTGNQTQPMLTASLQESTSQVDMSNSIDWVNSAYHKIQQIKEMYLSQFLTLHHKMQEMRRQATDVEVVNKCERSRRFIETTIRLFNASKQDLLQFKKERVSQILNEAMRYISQFRPRNSPYAKQTHQVEASGNHIEASQIQQRENHLQFNNPQGSLQQPLRPGGLPQSSFNSFNVGSSAGVLHHKIDASPNVNSYQLNNLMRPSQQWAPRKGGSQIGGYDPRTLRMLLHPPSNNVSQLNNLGASQQTVNSSRNVYNSFGNYSVSPVAQTPVSMPPLQNTSQQDQIMKRQKMKQPVQQLMNEKNKQQMMQKRNEDTKLRRFVGINQKWSPVPPSSSSPYAMSPQNSQQSSSQIELKDLSSMFPRSATPSLSSASPSALPSPLTPLTPMTPMTPLTPSSMPADSVMSPLLEESSKLIKNPAAASQPPSQDTNSNLLATDTQRSLKSCLQRESASSGDKQLPTEKADPLKRLVEVVKSASSKALNATIRDIDAVTSLNDRVAENLLRGKPTKVILRDLVDDIVFTCDEGAYTLDYNSGTKSGMKRDLDTVALDDFATDTDTYGSDSIKRQKINNLLSEEIKEINKKLIEVVVDVMTEEDDVSRPGFDEGTIVRCSYIPVGFSGNLKIPNTSKLMFPNLLLELIVSADYPNSSPTVLEKEPSGFCDGEEGKYMWMKAKTNFTLSLRKLSRPLSVKDIAEAWDVSAREIFHELVDQLGGGSFSSTYGKWENCAVAV